jgi:hypothetical protein
VLIEVYLILWSNYWDIWHLSSPYFKSKQANYIFWFRGLGQQPDSIFFTKTGCLEVRSMKSDKKKTVFQCIHCHAFDQFTKLENMAISSRWATNSKMFHILWKKGLKEIDNGINTIFGRLFSLPLYNAVSHTFTYVLDKFYLPTCNKKTYNIDICEVLHNCTSFVPFLLLIFYNVTSFLHKAKRVNWSISRIKPLIAC